MLHVVAPGLLGPVPAEAASTLYSAAPGHAEISFLLSRSRRSEGGLPRQGVAERLFELLRGSVEDMAPVAPYRALGDGVTVGRRAVFCADPVRLVPDRDQLRLFDPGPVHLSHADLAPFLEAFHQHFAADGLELRCHQSGRWYLLAESMPRLTVQPPDTLYGTSIGSCLPQGPDAAAWIQLLNAVQMLLHDMPFNRERESAGLPPVTGLWFWGGGEMDSSPVAHPCFDRIYSDDPLARGLAASADLICEPASAWHSDHAAVAGGDRQLLLTPALPAVEDAESFQHWHRALDAWCQTWGPPLLQQLRQAAIKRLTLETSGHQFRLSPLSLRAIWRRRRRLPHWLLRQ